MDRLEDKENLILLILHFKSISGEIKTDPSEIKDYLLDSKIPPFFKKIADKKGDIKNLKLNKFALIRPLEGGGKSVGASVIFQYTGSDYNQIVELIRTVCRELCENPPWWTEFELFRLEGLPGPQEKFK